MHFTITILDIHNQTPVTSWTSHLLRTKQCELSLHWDIVFVIRL